MERELDVLVEELLKHTMCLEQKVVQDASDPDEWLAILDEREHLIEQMQGLTETGITLSEATKKALANAHEINQRLIPLMTGRKQGVQNQLNNIQRSKMAMNTYNEVGPSAYGAFFDRKK